MNRLYYGDNLDVLRRHIPDESVDLVYLDPPFNSNRSYNVLFKHRTGSEAQAQIQAFDDTWTWSQDSEQEYLVLQSQAPAKVADAITAMRGLVGENDVLAYLVMMTARLIELHRVLKPTGSLYLHCDPTASHYLKVMLDAIFGVEHFRNEIIWQRTGAKGLMTTRLPTNHDVLLSYTKGPGATWNEDAAFTPYDENDLDEKTAAKYRYRDDAGRLYRLDNLINPNPDRPNLTYEFLGVTKVWRWTKDRMEKAAADGLIYQAKPGNVPQLKRYLDEQRGRPLSDVWTDIAPINSRAAERLGYPTQKPLALLERILALSTSPGDVLLDPFCGCGTAVDAAQKLGRRWVGIDITYLAVDLIDKRLRHTYGDTVADTYEVVGIPRDEAGARALFARNPFDFERWAVSLVGGQPNTKQVGDKGIDGVIRFMTDATTGIERVLVSVKGGKTVNPAMVRDLIGTIDAHKAPLGLLVTLEKPSRGMLDAARHSGTWTHPANGQAYPRVQMVTVGELLSGKRPNLPAHLAPYIQAERRQAMDGQIALL